ncbi:GMC oxidoreductase [Variovorax sp. dw_308]|uniref:GMC oxidoreductase n=1 Tax=Variovorax sp. dw_308 TaxID=2721546 RepID=UPI001C460ECF|nr:GMC family oxidoreductase [Variovorax sp. dw_308]
MFLDARKADCPLNRATQFAVVGAGPAGITIARELASVGPVLLIESGGLKNCDDVNALSQGESVGWDYSLTDSRARGFGGSSSLWAGWCAVLDDHDFVRREWVPESGWPIEAAQLAPFYARAASVVNLDRADFDAHSVAGKAVDLPFDATLVTPSVWRFGTSIARFGAQFRDAFEASKSLTALVHASVADIQLSRDGTKVLELLVRTLDGREGRVAADVVVLACGGIETPRLLLNANGHHPAGIGNETGLVGRFFMEHPHEAVHALELTHADWFEHSLHQSNGIGGQQFMLALGLTTRAQQTEKILNARAHVYRTPDMPSSEPPRLGLFMEQAPNPNSALQLSDSRDAIGLRRVRLDWQLDSLDQRSYDITCRLLAEEFARCGAGHLSPGRPSGSTSRGRTFIPTNHHIGTTRMSATSTEGVVDSDCRVHGIDNLYIAGSSVFPTSSWANPTFTLIALALRLADHLGSLVTHAARERDHG